MYDHLETKTKPTKTYITVNGHQAKALFDTWTMEDNLISGKFVSTFQIPTKDLETSISL